MDNIWTVYEFVVFFKKAKYELIRAETQFGANKKDFIKSFKKRMKDRYGEEFCNARFIRSYIQTY